MIGRKKKDNIMEAFGGDETPDLEIQKQEIIPPIYPEINEEVPQQPQEVPQQPQPNPQGMERTMVVDEPLNIKVIAGQTTDEGFLYTVLTNKPLANLGEVINLR